MAVWSVIKYSALAAGVRCDPEYYQPRYLADAKRLARTKPERIGAMAFVTDGIHGSPEEVEVGGVRYLSAKCVKDNAFALGDALQISDAQHAANPRTSLSENDVLITTVGTIGNAAVVQAEILPANSDRHLGIVRLNKDAPIDPYYLATFLNCEYGRFQSLREATGNVQLNLFIEKIRELRVPVLGCASQISKQTKAAYSKRREGEAAIAAAEARLMEALGLDRLDLSPQKCYTRRFRDLQAEARFDAEYFNPKYDRLLRQLAKHGDARLGDLLEQPIRRGIAPAYVEGGDVVVINSQHVRRDELRMNDNAMTSSALLKGTGRSAQLRVGDVLLNSTGYITIGRSQAIIDPIKAVADSHVAVLRTKLDPVFLSVFLNSKAGYLQTERNWTGSSGQIELRSEAVSNYRVWNPPMKEQLAIRALYEAGIKARREAARLLEQAKKTVEDLIANGGGGKGR